MLWRYLILLLVVLSVVAGTHYYFWARLVRDTGLPPAWRLLCTVLLGVLALSLPSSFFLMRLGAHAAKLVLLPMYVWMGLMLLMLTLLVGADLLRALLWLTARLARSQLLAEPQLRLAITRSLAGLVVAGAASAAAFGMTRALGPVQVRNVRIELPRLPAALSGTTLVQITDLHLGPTLGREWLDRVVDQVNSLDPDVVAITGDLIDNEVDKLAPAVQPLTRLRARQGIYFVTGNHEYYSGVEGWMPELKRLGIRVLRNERVAVGNGVASYDLAGVDDFSARGMAPGHGPDLPRALAGRDPSRALVLLAHQPRAVVEAARLGVGLVLSGHTHGGQFWPWPYFVYLQQPVVAGLARFGETQLYVSDGTGFWGPPIRIGTVCEITRVTLVAPGASR